MADGSKSVSGGSQWDQAKDWRRFKRMCNGWTTCNGKRECGRTQFEDFSMTCQITKKRKEKKSSLNGRYRVAIELSMCLGMEF